MILDFNDRRRSLILIVFDDLLNNISIGLSRLLNCMSTQTKIIAHQAFAIHSQSTAEIV